MRLGRRRCRDTHHDPSLKSRGTRQRDVASFRVSRARVRHGLGPEDSSVTDPDLRARMVEERDAVGRRYRARNYRIHDHVASAAVEVGEASAAGQKP